MDQLANQISRAARYNESFCVIVVDVDHFKRVNDTFGHHAGDIALRGVADQFKLALRAEDCCGRWGGEEFLICLPHTDLNGAAVVAEKLRQAVETAPVNHEGKSIHVTISLGVARYGSGQDLDSIVRDADRALYAAKDNGRNRVETYAAQLD